MTSFRAELIPFAAALSFLGVVGCSAGRTSSNIDENPDAGPANSCTTGGITFDFQVDAATYACFPLTEGPQGGCLSEWLSIVGPDGTALTIDIPCTSTCDSCNVTACAGACEVPTAVPSGTQTRTWDGTYFPSGSTCTSSTEGSGIGCVTPTCAAPGHYTAKMCAYTVSGMGATGGADSFCMTGVATLPTQCADVQFDWPPTTTNPTVTGSVSLLADGG